MSRRTLAIPARTAARMGAILLLAAAAAPAADLPEGVAPLDAPRRPSPAPLALRGAADSTIVAMTAAVDADSIAAFLDRLTGEVPVQLEGGPTVLATRLSGSPGGEHAAEFLRGTFEGFGCEVSTHYFRFMWGLSAVLPGPGAGGITAGANGRVLHSTDGVWWEEARAGVSDYDGTYYDIDTVTGDERLMVGTLGMIAASSDGGRTWTRRTSSATLRLSAVDVLPTGEGWIVGRDGVILRTTDGGVTWADQASGVTALLYDVAAFDANVAVAVGAAGTVLRTTDGGATWVARASGTTRDLYRVSFAGASGWAAGAGGAIVATVDGGATWQSQSSGTTATLNAVSFADGSDGWAVGMLGAMVRTTDGGATWTPQSSPLGTVSLLAVQAVGPGAAWVTGNAGAILTTTDGGTSWLNRTSGILDGWESVVATLPGTTDPDEAVLLVGHFDSVSQTSETYAPGADDNGSGTAAIVEAARRLAAARYRRSITFICFSGEEQGLVGSHAYAARALERGENITGVFNLDCVGWNDDYFRIFSNDGSAWLGDVAAQMAATYAPSLPTYHWFCDTCNWSDHYPFQTRGFDAICGIETWEPAPPQHHRTADTVALLDMALIADVTRIAVATMATVAGVDTTAVVGAPVAAATAATHLRALPSPFSKRTSVAFGMPEAGPVRLSVYDAAGRLVARLLDANRDRGMHAVEWDGRDDRGRTVANGVYFLRLERDGGTIARKLVRMR